MQDAALNHVTAGFLPRGQTQSSDSRASINLGRKKGEGTGCVPHRRVKGELEKGRPSSVAQEKGVYRKPKFFFSLSLFRVCEPPAWEPWD